MEIGSSVRPHPYHRKVFRSYIHDFLLSIGELEAIDQYQLREIDLNVLDISRTFVDKVMSVKRHSICGTLPQKVRHIYDVTRLLQREEIDAFLKDKERLREIVRLTKETDAFYLLKRNLSKDYDPTGPYDFEHWKDCFDSSIKRRFETLHKDLLYTDKRQDFEEAIHAFEAINQMLVEIGE